LAVKKANGSGSAAKREKKVKIIQNGPYVVCGNLPLDKAIIVANKDGEPLAWATGGKYPAKGEYALCRCGHSNNKPYCDASHAREAFEGTETASKKKHSEQAYKLSGPGVDLGDAPPLCAGARFCHRAGSVWTLTEKSGDPKAKKIAIQEACDCPSGRLVMLDKKSGRPIEPKLKQSLSLIEDPPAKVSGPIWVKGGIPIESADGSRYEVRNRATLCRCGKSANKPFCDGTHLSIGFNDGDKRLGKAGKR
jgi:CDGSH-type Zn-finger protein